jgi:outer membrane protein assembly factor BamB
MACPLHAAEAAMWSAVRFVVSAAILVASVPLRADGSERDNFPPLPGWSRPAPFTPSDAPLRHGILLDAPSVLLPSPLVAEIDGNLGNGREVALGTTDGVVHLFGADGSLRWQVRLVPTTCDGGILATSIMPTVAPIFGDGVLYLLVGYGGTAGGRCDGGLAAIHGATGQVAWRFSTLEWEQQQGYPKEDLHGVVVAPAAADTDGDGRMEIAFGAFDRNFYLLESDGTVRWYYQAADTIWSSPLFVQLDDDPQLEVVTASDVTLGPNEGGGYLQAFDTTSRYPMRIAFATGFLWRTPNLGQVPYSSPAVGDVLPEEPGDEIVIGSGCYFPPSGGDRPGKWVKIFRTRDGAEVQTLNVPPGGTCMSSSPALGDIDGDGRLEVVISNGDDTDAGGDGIGRVIAWDPETPSPKWSTIPHNPISAPGSLDGNDKAAGFFLSPVIADLDGNGSLEVVVANHWSVHVLAGGSGTPLTCQSLACGAQPSMFAWGSLKATPAVADVDGDGALDVVIAGMHVYSPAGGGFGASERAMVYAWTGFAPGLASAPGPHPPYAAPWPMFHGNVEDRPVGSGGNVSDVCLTTPEMSLDRLRCGMEKLLATTPCELPRRVTAAIERARRSLSGYNTGRRAIRRAARALAKALRLAGTQLAAEDCRVPVQTTLQELTDLARAIAAVTPPR